ncbi:MAG: hypothetical protein K2J63_07155 [Muribaculaceae bacterium]|nr:hypothetical protein [Muribaculaceae bacterium]
MDSKDNKINKYLSLRKGFKYLEILGKFPHNNFPDIISKGNWFQKLMDFLSVYLTEIEPFWSTVENYIKEHREEVYKIISEFNDGEKEYLTFDQAFIYISSWTLINPEKFFLAIGIPLHAVFKLSKGDKESFNDALCSFDSAKFLQNLWLMHHLECGDFYPTNYIPNTYNGRTFYTNKGSHLIDLSYLKPLFNTEIEDAVAINHVFDLVIRRLGIKNIKLLLAGSPKPKCRKIGTTIKEFAYPAINDENINHYSFIDETYINRIIKEIRIQCKEHLPTSNFSSLKNDCIELIDHILYQSIYENQKDLKAKFMSDEDIKFDYDFFPDSCGGYYRPLEQENKKDVFLNLLTLHLKEILKYYKYLQKFIPSKQFHILNDLVDNYEFSTKSNPIKLDTHSQNKDTTQIYSPELNHFFDENFNFANEHARIDFYRLYYTNILLYINSIKCYKDFLALCYLFYPVFSKKGKLKDREKRDKTDKHLQGELSWKKEPESIDECANRILENINLSDNLKPKESYSMAKLNDALGKKAIAKGGEWIVSFIDNYWPKRNKAKTQEPALYPIETFHAYIKRKPI